MALRPGQIEGRNFGLDLVRVISLVLILIQHASFDFHLVDSLKVGAFAVEIFFVLSGFLIGGILFRDIDKNQSASATLKTFIVRRWWRILPLYYVILFVALVDRPDIPLKDVAYYAFFIQGFHLHDGFFLHSWTLAVEEWFYLAAPLFVIIVCTATKDPKKIIVAFLLFMFASVLLRLGYVAWKGGQPGTYWIMKAIPVFRFDSLFCGVFVAYLHHIKHRWFEWMKKPAVFYSGIVCCVLYVALLQFGSKAAFRDVLVKVLPVIGFLFLSSAIAITLPYSMLIRKPGESRWGKLFYSFITYSSVMAYAIYLIHPFFYEWFSMQNPHVFTLMNKLITIVHSKIIVYAIYFVFRLAVIYAAAYIIYRFFEKPVLKLRDKLTGTKGVSLP